MATATAWCQWHGRKERTNTFRTRSCEFCEAVATGRRASVQRSSTGRLRTSWPAERGEWFSQRVSGQLTYSPIAGVLEEAPSIFGVNRPQGRSYRFHQSLFAPGRSLAEQVLDLGKRFFYGVVVGGVGRQVDQLAVVLLDQLPDALWPVGTEIVHHHDLAFFQVRRQHLLDVGLKDPGCGRSFHG